MLSYGDAVHVDRCAQLEATFTRAVDQALEKPAGGLVMQAQAGLDAGKELLD